MCRFVLVQVKETPYLCTMHREGESSFFQPAARRSHDYAEPLAVDAGSRQHIFYKMYRNGSYYFLKSLRPDYLGQTFFREVLRKEYELGSTLDAYRQAPGWRDLPLLPAE